MPRRKKRDSPIHVNEGLNHAFTLVFLLEVVGVFAVLYRNGPGNGCDWSPEAACGALLASCAAIFVIVSLVKWTSRTVGLKLSKHVFPGDALGKSSITLHKFEDQMWQLTIHASMTALEMYILFFEDGGKDSFWSKPTDVYAPHPRSQNNKLSVHAMYLVQMSIWLVTCFQHRFVEERHKDYFMMYIHHLVTIALVFISYSYNYLRIGVYVLFLHDVSDIWVDLIKIFNYCQLEGAKGAFLVEIVFISNFASWAYFRMYMFAYEVIYRRVWSAAREVGTQPGEPTLRDFARRTGGEHTRGHPKGWSLGDGSFDVWANWRALPYCGTTCGLDFFWESFFLLCALQIMHFVWYGMFLRILRHQLTGSTKNLHEAGRDVYEGESDDEAAEQPERRRTPARESKKAK